MGWNLFDEDWKNILAFLTVAGLVVGYITKAHIKLKNWLITRPSARFSQLEKRVADLEMTIETKDNIHKMLGEIKESIENHHRLIINRFDTINSRMIGVEKGIAYASADMDTLIGANVWTFKTDEEGRWVHVSPGVRDIMKRPYEEVKDFNFLNAIEPTERAAFMERYRYAIANGMRIDEVVTIEGVRSRIKAHRIEFNGAGYLGYAGTITKI